MKTLLLLVAGAGLALALCGCEPYRISDETRYDAVATLFDKTADFGAFQTFALSDTVAHLGTADITRAYDAQILDRIRNNMIARGYTEVAQPANADMVVPVGITTSTYLVSTGGWCDYWGYYSYWYGCGGWYYPSYTYSYTTGSVLFAIIDQAKRANPDTPPPAAWVASVSDVVSYSASSATVQKALANIDQAFVQSPYVQADLPVTSGVGQ